MIHVYLEKIAFYHRYLKFVYGNTFVGCCFVSLALNVKGTSKERTNIKQSNTFKLDLILKILVILGKVMLYFHAKQQKFWFHFVEFLNCLLLLISNDIPYWTVRCLWELMNICVAEQTKNSCL